MSARTPFLERFMRWVEPEPNSGCWLWIGVVTANGYGMVSYHGHQRRAHRVAYEVLIGPAPDGLEPDHLCRVRSCVNPWHLEFVTNKVNTLRGVSFAAVNAKKTHCSRGHAYSDDNVIYRRGRRECRECSRQRHVVFRSVRRIGELRFCPRHGQCAGCGSARVRRRA